MRSTCETPNSVLDPTIFADVCSHDGLTGDRAVQFLDGGAYQFRGRRIYDAVIDSLLAQHGLVRAGLLETISVLQKQGPAEKLKSLNKGHLESL